MKIAIIAWNPLQLEHFRNLIPYYDDLTICIIRREQNLKRFSDEFLASLNAPGIQIVPRVKPRAPHGGVFFTEV